jgi:cytochrome c2
VLVPDALTASEELSRIKPDVRIGCQLNKSAAANVRNEVLSKIKAQNVTWDEANLDAWLQGPGKFVRGTKMIYSVPDEKDRQDVIAYLKMLPK